MKKFILGIVAVLACTFAVSAQTDFRHISFDEAKKAAKAENKQIFIDFFTEWCGPCKRLAKLTFPDKTVGNYLNKNFVCLKVDAEKGEGIELAKAYKVKAYPTLCVLNADGTLCGSFAGFKEGAEFINAVESVRNPELSYENVKEKYEAGNRAPEIVQSYVFHMIDRSRDYVSAYKQADEIYTEYFNSLNDADKQKKENQFLYLTPYFSYGSPIFDFMLGHMNMFDAESAPKAKEVVENIYKNASYQYFTSTKPKEDKTGYEALKKAVKKAGLMDTLAKRFEFADKRAALEDVAYLEYVDKNFNTLSEEEQSSFCYRIMDIFPEADDAKKAAISKVVRRHIGNMGTNAVYSAAMAISNLEGKDH